jgi:hypothetical protein
MAKIAGENGDEVNNPTDFYLNIESRSNVSEEEKKKQAIKLAIDNTQEQINSVLDGTGLSFEVTEDNLSEAFSRCISSVNSNTESPYLLY